MARAAEESIARWIILGLGVATFLAAAKAHGRQLRLERELAGYFHVTFGAKNPAFVEALWRREQLGYWTLAAALTALTIGFRFLAPRFAWPLPLEGASAGRSFLGVFFLHVLVPLVTSFAVTGLASLVRFALAIRSGAAADRPATWLSNAVWGSAAWWTLTLALAAALCVVAWQKARG